MKNRTKSSAKNAIFGITNQTISMVLNFLGRTVFIYVLGAEYLGINGLFSDILIMLSLAEMGLRTSMAYTFYKPLAENDTVKVAMLTQFYKKVYHTIAVFVTVVGVSLVPFLDYLVNLDNSIPYLKIYYLFFLGDIVASYFFIYKTSVIEADQKKYLITKYQMIVNIVKIIFQMGILLFTHNYFLYLSLQIFSTLANNFIVSKKASQLYPILNENHGQLEKEERRTIFENMKSMFIFKLSTTVLKGTDNILMSVLFGTIWVGIYSNYYLVIASLENFISVIYTSVTASIGNIIAMESPEKRYEIFQLTKMASLIITTFTTICLYMLINDFIYVWLGDTYTITTIFLGAIILNYYLKVVTFPILSFRQATGLYIQTRYVMLVAAILNIVFSLFMSQLMGISGILYASVLAQLVTSFWIEPRLLFNQFFNKETKTYFVSIFINFLSTAMFITFFQFIMKNFVVKTWSEFLIKTVIVGIVSLLFTLFFYYRTKDFKILRNRFIYLIKKNKNKNEDLKSFL